MNAERLKQIDEAAIAGQLPDRLTVQALVAEIRILRRAVDEQAEVLRLLRQAGRPARVTP